MLVLSASLGTSSAVWDPQMVAFAGQFRVLRYEHRGHGGTAAPPGPYTIDELASDLLGLLDDLDIGRASICGRRGSLMPLRRFFRAGPWDQRSTSWRSTPSSPPAIGS